MKTRLSSGSAVRGAAALYNGGRKFLSSVFFADFDGVAQTSLAPFTRLRLPGQLFQLVQVPFSYAILFGMGSRSKCILSERKTNALRHL